MARLFRRAGCPRRFGRRPGAGPDGFDGFRCGVVVALGDWILARWHAAANKLNEALFLLNRVDSVDFVEYIVFPELVVSL